MINTALYEIALESLSIDEVGGGQSTSLVYLKSLTVANAASQRYAKKAKEMAIISIRSISTSDCFRAGSVLCEN